MKEKIVEYVIMSIRNKNITELDYEQDLKECGLDSVAFIRLIVTLEEELDCEIPESKLLIDEMNTINKIYEVVASLTIP